MFTVLIILFINTIFLFATDVGSGSYRDSIPPDGFTGPVYKTSDLDNKPLPTNDWWSSILFQQTSKNMYAFPLCYRADSDGLVMGTPDYVVAVSTEVCAKFQTHIKMRAFLGETKNNLTADSVKASGFTDWTATAKWEHSSDSSKFFTSTMGQGMVFTYFDFQGDIKPEIVLPIEWGQGGFYIYKEDLSGFISGPDTTHPVYGDVKKLFRDRVAIRVSMDCNNSPSSWEHHYYGTFLPEGTTVYAADYNISGEYAYHRIIIELPENERYVSIGLMTEPNDLEIWKDYAYNFVTDTQVSWAVNETNNKVTNTYQITTDDIRTETANDGGDTIMALFPHHYKNTTGLSYMSQTFSTLRGNMKLIAGKSFETILRFFGIVPFFDDNGTYDKDTLKDYLNYDKNTLTLSSNNFYMFGKNANNAANLIRVADMLGETQTRDHFLNLLKNGLVEWLTYYSGKTQKYFYYNDNLNSLIEYPHNYGAEYLNDHHFHYGYFVYAAAVLAFYDSDFKDDYGEMIGYLIRDYASLNRSDDKFPFLRNFGIYEGHSWANGFGGGDNNKNGEGNDQESSSEAMNAWVGVYLWGLINQDDDYKNLGIFGYVTEYSAIETYWADIDGDIYPVEYNKTSLGILFGNKMVYDTWWDSKEPEHVYGIQMLPLNPTSLYLGYDEDYVIDNYNSFKSENGDSDATTWQDIFWQYQSLYAPLLAVNNFDPSITYGSTVRSFLYYFIHIFNKLGEVSTRIYADHSSYSVIDKNGVKTYFAFNPTSVAKRVEFRNVSDDSLIGAVVVPAKSLVATSSLSNDVTAPTNIETVNDGPDQGFDIDYSSETSSISGNWTESSDPESGISSYLYCVGTDVGGNNIKDWTQVSSDTLKITTPIDGLEIGVTYYFSVKATNTAGLESDVTTSDGIILDNTAPSQVAMVYDGDVDFVDKDEQAQNKSISASWDASSDDESGIANYYYSIGTSQGDTSVKDWTSVNERSFTDETVSLEQDTTYYVNIKSVNNASLESEIQSSDGILIDLDKPELEVLNDGNSLDEDIDVSNSSDTLKAVWRYKNAVKYYYAVSTDTASNGLVWEETTNVSIVKTGLDLQNETTYYVFVKAESSEGAVSSAVRTDGVFIVFEKPTGNIKLNKEEPVDIGKFEITLDVESVLELKNKPNLSYSFSDSTGYVKIALQGSGKSWKGEGFIDFDRPINSMHFIFDVEDIAGNIGEELSKSTFTVDTSFDINKDKTFTTEDGTELVIPAGTFDEKAKIVIKIKDSNDSLISKANQSIKNHDFKDFAGSNGIFREFKALDNNNKEITKFNKDMTIKIPYEDVNSDRILDGTDMKIVDLSIFYLDEISNVWTKLEKVEIDYFNKNINATIPHLSVYGILPINDINDLKDVILYPNPLYVNRHNKIKIDKLPNNVNDLNIRVYDITGRCIRKFDENDLNIDYSGNYVEWDAMTNKGDKVASGIYIILIKTEKGARKEKVAILW
jgi:endoglucanase Acf2